LEDYYKTLEIKNDASIAEIKRAFREKAKKLHPDIARQSNTEELHRVLTAYEVLSNHERRFEYDKLFRRNTGGWDYRSHLRERSNNPEYQAELIFFELLHFEEDRAVKIWHSAGGINFPLRKYFDREDWMDCGFLLAEELEKEHFYYEAFLLLVQLLIEERKNPYFRHFSVDVEFLLTELVRVKLRRAVDNDVWIECMHSLIGLGFSDKTEARWLKSLAETLFKMNDKSGAAAAYHEAKSRDEKVLFSKKFTAFMCAQCVP
jgi:hypothetical protein